MTSTHPKPPAALAVSQALEALRRIEQQQGCGQRLSTSDIEQATRQFHRAWLSVTQIQSHDDALELDSLLARDHVRGWLERVARSLLALRFHRLAPHPQPLGSAYNALRNYDARWRDRNDVGYLSDCLAQDLLVETDSPIELKRQIFDALTELVERLRPLPALSSRDPLAESRSLGEAPSAFWVRLDQQRRRYQGLLDPRYAKNALSDRITPHPVLAAALSQESPLGHRLLDEWQWLRGARRAARWRRLLMPWTTTRGRLYLWRHPGLVLTRCIILALVLVASVAAWFWWLWLR